MGDNYILELVYTSVPSFFCSANIRLLHFREIAICQVSWAVQPAFGGQPITLKNTDELPFPYLRRFRTLGVSSTRLVVYFRSQFVSYQSIIGFIPWDSNLGHDDRNKSIINGGNQSNQ